MRNLILASAALAALAVPTVASATNGRFVRQNVIVRRQIVVPQRQVIVRQRPVFVQAQPQPRRFRPLRRVLGGFRGAVRGAVQGFRGR